MHVPRPTADAFPLVKELTVPPWPAFQAALARPYPLFLDSALRHPSLGRYSYVTADPFAVLRCRHPQAEWLGSSTWQPPCTGNPFELLAAALAQFRSETMAGLPPFQGGAAGLFGYDLCHHIERLPRPLVNDFATPDLAVGFYDWVYAFDHLEERGWLISTGFPETDPTRRTKRAEKHLRDAVELLTVDRPLSTQRAAGLAPAVCGAHTAGTSPAARFPLAHLPGVYSNFARSDFLAIIRRAIEYVHAGDCFQVNVAQRLLAPLRHAPIEIYRKLRDRNPATFGGYFDMGDFVIASASPERFLTLSSRGDVETRPIKGTRPRGATSGEDQQLRQELERSAKDRAENVMIVDLLRNDLGRVCEYGSIQVPHLCQLESYQTVHHLVSVVIGRLREGKNAVDLLRAAFPGGSVTGAPKIRAMEIIAELEPTARGPYCGSLGYVGFDGAMDTNILIRTFTIGKGWIQFPVGGGIVADSDPECEYEETLHKAAGMLRALE